MKSCLNRRNFFAVWTLMAVIFGGQVFVNTSLSAAEGLAGAAPFEYVANEIIVKFRGQAADAIESKLAAGGSWSELELRGSLSELKNKYRVKSAGPVFKDFKKNRQKIQALLTKGKELLGKKEKHILRRLQHAPRNAAVPELDRIYKLELELEAGQSLTEVAAAYNRDPDVEYAELNYVVSASLIPNDPLFSEQWSLAKIDAPSAWDIHTGSSDIIVAVIDTGVDYEHADLDDNMWVNTDEIAGNGIDDDGNGYIDDVYGYDFINDDSDPADDHGHGTHCSGTIAAETNSKPKRDVAGVCWKASIMGLKFLGADGYGSDEDAVKAFYYAVENGADITSNSWGGGAYSETMEEAINYAYSQGVIMVAAAGNDNSNLPHYPAFYEHMISVAATDLNDQRASFSNYGGWVDIAAPGVDVLSLIAGGGTIEMSGTSMACPHVAGAYALLLSANPMQSCDEIYDALVETVDPISPEICLSGRLNLSNAMSSVVSPKGRIALDHDSYARLSVVSVRLADSDLDGEGSYEVSLTTSGGDSETVVLTEIVSAIGIFTGTIPMASDGVVVENGTLDLSHGDIITATYLDSDDGSGNPATVTDTAVADYLGPVIFDVGVRMPGREPRVKFETDEPAETRVLCGLACGGPYTIEGSDASLIKSHNIKLTELSPETEYFYIVEATDAAGNKSVDTNGGQCYTFTTIVSSDIYVPSQCLTIQEAIDNSWDEGTVWVADGTYSGEGNRDIDFKGRAITIRSENGPENCIIDCGGTESELHRGFIFQSGEGADSILAGLTITNGHELNGGAIYNLYSSQTVINCKFIDNSAWGGAAIWNWSNRSTLTDCMFINNTAEYVGGGIHSVYDTYLMLTNCTFIGNAAGGGSVGEGGAIFRGKPVLNNCIFIGNTSGSGGALNCMYPTVTNCMFSGNTAFFGGGIYGADPVVTNCSFVGNRAYYWGGGMYVISPVVTNCIFRRNRDNGGIDESAQIHTRSGVPVVNYSCIEGWTGNLGGTGNIDSDPLFIDPGYWNGYTWVEGDYHLQAGSVCIDAGDPTRDYTGQVDIDGQTRVMNNRVDMGADEFTTEVSGFLVNIDPDTLNLSSQDQWITCYIRLGEDYDVADIDLSSIILEETITPAWTWVSIKKQFVMAKFRRSDIQPILEVGYLTLTVSCRLVDGTEFQGADTIRVIDNSDDK